MRPISLGEGFLILLVVIILGLCCIWDTGLKVESACFAQREETRRLGMQIKAAEQMVGLQMQASRVYQQQRQEPEVWMIPVPSDRSVPFVPVPQNSL